MHLRELKNKPINELVKLAESMGLENMARLRKQDIIFSILNRGCVGDSEAGSGLSFWQCSGRRDVNEASERVSK